MNPVKIAHLSWVRAPIEKAIELCRLAMVDISAQHERLNSPPNGAQQLWFVNQRENLEKYTTNLTDALAGIEAALDITGCSGGTVLAREMRTLASLPVSDDLGAHDKTLLCIQDSLTVLPSYLGMVIEGAHDSPGILLKYINELRALRGVPALADESSLPINLSFAYKSPPLYEPDCDISDRDRVFGKAASNFGLLYSQAMKGNGNQPWLDMREHLKSLQRVTNDAELGCYWWVGEAILDVIIADGLYMPPAMNTALRVVMVATQRLPQGEQAAKEGLNPAKFSALLNSLSVSRKQSHTSSAVIAHFDVLQNVEEDRVAQLHAMLEAQSVQSIADVLPEIKPRLEAAMVSFGRAVSAKHIDGFKIQSQVFDQAIRTIANVFGIFNEAELSDLCFGLADMVKGVTQPSAFTPEIIEAVKTQILFLDSKLNHLDSNEAADQLHIQGVTPDVISVIANVTFADLKKVSHMIATHVDSGMGSDKLLAALNALHELSNVYEFAGSRTIGNILGAIVAAITNGVKESVLTDSENLRHAARAMAALEMYLQYITTGLQPPTTLIEVATTAVQAMGMDVATFESITQNDLLAKFERSAEEEDDLDPLLSEIFELRPYIESLHKCGPKPSNDMLSSFATACLRLGATAQIKGEAQLTKLCRRAAELASEVPGRVDDPLFDAQKAHDFLNRASEFILRSLDEYAAKGTVHIFLIDFIDRLSSFIGHEYVEPVTKAVATMEPQNIPVREMPSDYDPILQTLFDEEFAENLAILKAFAESQPLAPTEAICRSVHTIRGISMTAKCEPIATVFDVLEARFYALKAENAALSEIQAADLGEMLSEMALYQAEFPWTTATDLLPTWLEVAGTMVGPIEHQDDESPQDVLAGTETVATLAPIAVDEADTQIVVPPAPQPIPQAILTTSEEAPEYDLEQYDLYLCDADEVIPELQQNVQSWLLDMGDKELAVCIRRNMHTLKGAAAIINASGIRTLTHHMESLFDAMSAGGITGDAHCADLVNFVLNEIETMSHAVRLQAAYKTPTTLIEFVAKSAEIYRVDGDELKAVLASSGGPGVSQPVLIATAQPPVTPPPVVVLPAEPTLPPIPAQAPEPSVITVEQPLITTLPEKVAEVIEQVAAPSAENVVMGNAEGSQQPVKTNPTTTVESPSNSMATFRRGYRGLRGRAVGERQRLYEQRQSSKAMSAEGLSLQPLEMNAEPDYTEINTVPAEMSSLVKHLIHRASESARESRTLKKRTAASEKIKVELQLLDNSVQQANELKASTYRQSTLYREMLISIVALREKLSLHLMHHNKTTVQLRNFNNMTNSLGHHVQRDAGDDEQRLYLERFNHLSNGNTQSGVQIEQMLQDVQDIITQSHLMDTGFKHQSEVVTGLQRDLLLTKLVQFRNERPGMNGAFTSALKDTQKKATLDLVGGETLIDTQMLEAIRDPLRHVINNSIAHGIESPTERAECGKDPSGKVVVKAFRRSKTLVIAVTDDGRGIDPALIREKAISSGVIKAEDKLTDQELIYLITAGGLSTAKQLDELSGRGVGMDIVRNKLSELGGQLYIHSEVGKGTTMELELPLTVGSNRALVCSVGDQWYAIPTYNMVQVLDYPTTDLLAKRAKNGSANVEFEGNTFDVVHMADLIAIPDLKVKSTQALSHTTLVLVHQNNTRLAIEVESGVSMPEIHVTKFNGILSGVKGIIGSTEIHDGTPAIVLDVIELARLNLTNTSDGGFKPKLYRIRRIRREPKPLVLIVDDSNSYRRQLTTHFKDLGWEVAVARDGQDALDTLPSLGKITLFVVDVEMPRMDGLALTRHLRSQQHYDDIPIIMLTTRSNLKEEALEIGVNHFLSKPYAGGILNEAIKAACPALELAGAA